MAKTEKQRLSFKVNGKKPDETMQRSLDEILVDSSLRMPDMCTLRFSDARDLSLILSLDNNFGLGDPLEVVTGSDGDGDVIFKGEITSIEPNFAADNTATLTILAYDKSHRLHRGRYSRVFQDEKQGISDGTIVKKMAKEAGIDTGTIQDGIKHFFVMQHNQTNMEWLLSRAEQLDFQVYVDADEKLHFVKAEQARSGTAPTLTWGDDLLSFRPRLTAVHQTPQVNVIAWDQKEKKAIKGSFKGISRTLKQAKTGTRAEEAQAVKTFKNYKGKGQVAVVAPPVDDAAAADIVAQGYANALSGEFLYAEGVCYGNTAVVVGGKVKIKLDAEKFTTLFSGEYRISAARQIYSAYTGRWDTHFTISGRQPTSLGYLMSGGNGHDAGYNQKIMGVVAAQVTNFDDKDGLGRIKVKYPLLIDDKGVEVESDWIRIATPSAGAQRGFYWLPEVNDEVLVAFEYGDPNRPYVIGSLWNGKDKPPLPNNKMHDGAKITQRMMKSRSGHVIILDDTNGSEQIIVRDKSEKNEIVINTTSNSIEVKAQQDINFTAGGKFNIKADGGVLIDTKGNMDLKSAGKFSLDGKAGNKITGARAEINVNGNLKLIGNVLTQLKGNLIKVDGGLAVEVKGGVIRLN